MNVLPTFWLGESAERAPLNTVFNLPETEILEKQVKMNTQHNPCDNSQTHT